MTAVMGLAARPAVVDNSGDREGARRPAVQEGPGAELHPAGRRGRRRQNFGVPLGAAGQVKAKGEDGQEVVLKRGVTAARRTFVIGPDGKIAFKNTRALTTQDAKRVAAFIDQVDKR